MAKYLGMIIALLAYQSAAAAEKTNTTNVKVNCSDIKLSINTVMDDRFNFSAYWNEPAVFPKKPEYIEIGDTVRSRVKRFNFQCPDIQVNYNGDVAEIKATNYDTIFKYIDDYDAKLHLYFHGWYKYEYIKEGFNSVGYGINIKNFKLFGGAFDLPEDSKLDSDFKFYEVPKTATVGYRIDGSELKPALYNRTTSNYLFDMHNAKTVDIYHKIEDDPFYVGAAISRVYIDKPNATIRIYRNYPFPTK